MNATRALVTGGAGFIGSHVVDHLLASRCKVVIYDNFSTGREEFLSGCAGNPLLRVIRGDTLDRSSLAAAAVGCDVVFHFQANADVRGGTSDTRVDLEQNTMATWNVLEAARVAGATRFVFASSATVYGEPSVFPTPESYAGLQTSLYGASKLAGEALCEAYAEYFGQRCFIFRFTSWVGERYSHGVVFDFVTRLRENPDVLHVLGDGDQEKSYLYVGDGIAGMQVALDGCVEPKNRINLGHDEAISVRRLAAIVIDEMGLTGTELQFSGGVRGWPGDSPRVELDTTVMRRLGWAPTVSIEEGVRRTVRYLVEHPHLLAARR